jgi:phage baseplate assembly protein gpV
MTLEGSGASLPLRLGESLLEAHFELNGDGACRKVSASGWNTALAAHHYGVASRSRLGRTAPAEVPPSRVGGTGERVLVDESAQDDRHAEALAQAELDVRGAGEVTLHGIAEGDPRLRPGARVDVSGVERAITGTYVLTEVTHVVDSSTGFTSQFSTAPPRLRRRTRGASLALGQVTSVDDPEHLGRVRVSLPTCADVETDWMPVVLPAAGKDKGLIVLPDTGDTVLIVFAHEDPSNGLVLGGLYGPSSPPDDGVESGARKRYNFVTPAGQRVQLDDANGAVRIENGDGSYVQMAPDKTVIHSARDLTIEAPGRAILIQGDRVDFERV